MDEREHAAARGDGLGGEPVGPAWLILERLHDLRSAMDGLDTRIGALDASLGAVDARIGAVDARVGREVERLHARITTEFGRLDAKIDRLDPQADDGSRTSRPQDRRPRHEGRPSGRPS